MLVVSFPPQQMHWLRSHDSVAGTSFAAMAFTTLREVHNEAGDVLRDHHTPYHKGKDKDIGNSRIHYRVHNNPPLVSILS